MTISINDPFGGLLILVIVIAVLWLIAYSASRVAIGDTREAIFAATFAPHADHVHLVIANIGHSPAFRVAVRFANRRSGAPLAAAEFLGPLAPLEIDLPVPEVIGERAESSMLLVEWRTGTEAVASYRKSYCSALAPSRLLELPPPGLPPTEP